MQIRKQSKRENPSGSKSLAKNVEGIMIESSSESRDPTDEERLNIKLKKSEEQYRLLAENARQIIIAHKPDGEITYINKYGIDFFKVAKNELIGKSVYDFLGTKDHAIKESTLKDFMEGERGAKGIMVEFSNKKSEKRHLEIIASPIFRMGTLDSILLNAYDVTERINSELRIQESKEKYRLIIENQNDLIVKLNSKYELLFANPKYFKVFGLDENEAIGKSFMPLVYKDDIEAVKKSIGRLLQGENKTYLEERAKTVDGWRCFGWSLSVIRDEKGTIHEIIAVGRDISDRKMAEEQKRESEEKYRAAFYTSPDSVNINKMNGEYVEINEGFKKLTGFTEEDVIGKLSTEIDIWAIPEDRKKLVEGLEKKGIVENLESVFQTKDGALIPALMSAKIIYLNQKPHILSVTREIKERKRMEQDLIEAKEKAEESNRLKTKFLNNMSHEIRTPMNGIMGFSELLDNPNLPHEKRVYFTKIIQNSSRQLLKVMDDILEISTLETKQLKIHEESFSLNDLLMDVFSIFNLKSKERNVPIYVKKGLKDKQSRIILDKGKLLKILHNLIENAIKFTFQGHIELGYYKEQEDLIIYVSDTGIGISKENCDKIFERFSQEDEQVAVQHGGLGLGLSISKENANLLGGDISVKSEKGKGSTFFVRIPYHAVYESNEENAKKEAADHDIVKILVAEDEEVNYFYIETLLESLLDFKYSLDHVKNGKEAVDYCQNNSTTIVLMDIKMPVMNGFEASRIIKTMNPEIKIIAQTAYTTEEDRLSAKESGCVDFISKPLNKDKLISLIKKHSGME